jgi:hypothetical protein
MLEELEEKGMKVLLTILLLQHAVISARAGYITLARGLTNIVAGQDHIGQGNEIRSEPGSRFEASLGPDSYLRLRGAARIVLESEALDNAAVRLIEGAMIVDARNVDGNMPIRIFLDDLVFAVHHDGLYLVEPDRVTVLDGELRVEGDAAPTGRLRKQWSVERDGGTGPYLMTQLSDTDEFENMALVRWSRQRAEQLEPRPTFRRRRGGQPFFF